MLSASVEFSQSGAARKVSDPADAMETLAWSIPAQMGAAVSGGSSSTTTARVITVVWFSATLLVAAEVSRGAVSALALLFGVGIGRRGGHAVRCRALEAWDYCHLPYL